MSRKHLNAVLAVVTLAYTSMTQATIVEVTTNVGKFEINLYDQSTPVTVQNFLSYANSGKYNGTVIHRSEPGFVIQGGGFTFDQALPLKAVTTNPAIINEPKWSNVRGTVAMAKLGGNPNSATNQWFVNLSNNASNLDFQNSGFTVFGQISSTDMSVIDAIAALPRFSFNGLTNLPLRQYSADDFSDNKPLVASNFVVIESVVVVDARPDTVAGLSLVPTTNKGAAAGDDSSGGSMGWLSLFAAALLLRRRNTR